MITGDIQESKMICHEKPSHTIPVDSRNEIHHQEMNIEESLYEESKPVKRLSKLDEIRLALKSGNKRIRKRRKNPRQRQRRAESRKKNRNWPVFCDE